MWSDIAAQKPDLLILSGDNIYADTHDMKKMKEEYDLQKYSETYQSLIKNVPVIGIWDDHDYGVNDGGKNFSGKDESKALMLDFLDVPKSNEVWKHKGAYNSYTYGSGSRKIKVILLDGRYFRDTLMADTLTSARYLPNKTGDILGEAQWKWLENELATSDAAINILVSGIQIVAKEHDFEKWANFPTSRQRLLDMLVKLKPKGTFILSGDRHIAEISKMDLPGLPYPLYDLTSSGLTHTWEKEWPESNKYRVGQLVIKKNYGLLNINWSKEAPTVTFEAKGHNDSTFLTHTFSLNSSN